MHDHTLIDRLYDLPRLLSLRAALSRVEGERQPRVERVAGALPGTARRLGVLAGSFNPLTLAHTTLAEAGLSSGQVDQVSFALSTRTINKDQIEGAVLEDRLLVLALFCDRTPGCNALILNRGLYVDQAEALRAAFPQLEEIVFLVGFDKIVQIFDRRYYDDRDASLERLFGQSRFLVAARDQDGPTELNALLSLVENRRFATAIDVLDLAKDVREISSSRVRCGEPFDGQLPPEAEAFVLETGAYAPSESTGRDRYLARLAALDRFEATGTSSPEGFRTVIER